MPNKDTEKTTKGEPGNKNKMSLKTYYGILSPERTFMATVPTATEQGCSHFRVEDFKRTVADICPSLPQEKRPMAAPRERGISDS